MSEINAMDVEEEVDKEFVLIPPENEDELKTWRLEWIKKHDPQYSPFTLLNQKAKQSTAALIESLLKKDKTNNTSKATIVDTKKDDNTGGVPNEPFDFLRRVFTLPREQVLNNQHNLQAYNFDENMPPIPMQRQPNAALVNRPLPPIPQNRNEIPAPTRSGPLDPQMPHSASSCMNRVL